MKLGGVVVLFFASVLPNAAESQGSIAGRVLSDSTRTPIPGAELIIAGSTRSAITDSSGRFVLRDVPAGMRLLIVRALGFRPDTSEVELFDNESLSREIFLRRRITTLGEVNIRDSAPSMSPAKLMEFDERRRSGTGGRFLDSTVVAKWVNRKTGDLLSTVPGIDVQRQRSAAYLNGGRAPPSMRTGTGFRPPPCYMDVYLDGAPLALGNTAFDVNSINMAHIAAIEVYSGAANTPARYNRTSAGCGVVLLWTK